MGGAAIPINAGAVGWVSLSSTHPTTLGIPRLASAFCDSAAHRSAARERTTADGASGKADGRPTTARASPLGRRRRISARTRGRGRRDPNDGMGFVVGVASVVNLMQETRELVAIEPRPVAIQAGEEFELAACEYRHSECRNAEAGDIGPVKRCGCGGSRPAALAPRIDRSARHRTTGNICRSSCRRMRS